jgi:tetratricopeptide (TPR) repeat protein
MRTVFLVIVLITALAAGCARRDTATAPSAATPTQNSDAIGATVLVPLPGITDDHPAPDNVLGLDKAETAQAEKPDDPTANLNLALSYYKAKSYADAARCFARAAQLMPENPTPLVYLGYTQMAVGALDSALKTFDQVLTAKKAPRETLSDVYYNIGVCRAALQENDAAFSAYTKALAQNPKNGMAALALGARAAEKGQMAQAKDLFTRATKDLPLSRHKAQAHAALGKLAEQKKDTSAAVSEYKKALAIDRDNAWADEGVRRLAPGKNG